LTRSPPSACIEETPEQLLLLAREDAHAFRATGIPVLRIYERDSYPITHTPDDRPERLNYTLAAECARIVAGTVVGLDAAGDEPEIDLWVENGTVMFTTADNALVEVIVDGTSLRDAPVRVGHPPERSTHRAGGRLRPHRDENGCDGHGRGGRRSRRRPYRRAASLFPGEPTRGDESAANFTTEAIPLSYHLDRPEEVARVDGYFDGVLIRDLENGLAVIPVRGRTPSRPWPTEPTARSSGPTGPISSSCSMGWLTSTADSWRSMRPAG